MLEQHLRKLTSPPLRISDHYADLIRQNCRTRSLPDARCLHDEIRRVFHNEIDPYVANLLILLYSSCGSVRDAVSTFDTINQRNVFSWNMLVTAYARNGNVARAENKLNLYPNHSSIAFHTIINAYATTGAADRATRLFHQIREPCVVAWTALIAAHTVAGHHDQSLRLFRTMCQTGVGPDRVALISILEACGSLRDTRSIHTISLDAGLIHDTQLWSTLLNAYGRNRRADLARSVFQSMKRRGLAAWNALITALAKNGDLLSAREVFLRMPERDVISWTALFAEVAQSGELEDARDIFDQIPQCNDIAWNAMIAAYAQNGHGDDALHIFRAMDLDGVFPNRATFVSALDACTISSSAPKTARFLLEELRFFGYTAGGDIRLDTALINLYGKIGSVSAASEIFTYVVQKNEICWNSIIAAYATNGHFDVAVALFQAMNQDGFHPNNVTFRIVLGGLSHAGLMDPACKLFTSLIQDYSIQPRMEHYVCIVDLLARVGRVVEATELVAGMPYHPDPVAWTALLGACKLQSEHDVGLFAAGMLAELNSEKDSPYVVLSHLFKTSSKYFD